MKNSWSLRLVRSRWISLCWMHAVLLFAFNTPNLLQADMLLSADAVEEILPWYDRANGVITNAKPRERSQPLELLLAKSVVPAEDGHVDGVLWFQLEEGQPNPQGTLLLRLLDAQRQEVARDLLTAIPGEQVFFSVALPQQLEGEQATLEVVWVQKGSMRDPLMGKVVGRASTEFEVAAAQRTALQGRVPIRIPNEDGLSVVGLPVSVGVPLQRGALRNTDSIRLLDAAGNSVPVQTEVLSRWSRHGTIRWLRCSFLAHVDGVQTTYYLEYDNAHHSSLQEASLEVDLTSAIPEVETGRLSLRRTGVWVDVDGDGDYVQVLGPDALRGGFVQRADGTLYTMNIDGAVEIESIGSESVTLLASGYFTHAATGEEFCRFNTRYIMYRDSLILRIVHTWIFTGDGNRDTIRDMGWRFPLAETLSPEGFLTATDRWVEGDYLLQYDFDQSEIVQSGAIVAEAGRAPGAAAAAGSGVRFALGVRDYWQNFPNELEFDDHALIFHNWPRHGKERRSEPATVEDAIRLRFVHEGEVLDFRLPDEFLTGPIYENMSRNRGYEKHWDEHQPESANAQGIARTEEMWLVFSSQGESLAATGQVLKGLNHESLRAVVDPSWIAATEVLPGMHPRDLENFPEHEALYEEIALAPYRWVERVGLYGMWIFGDNLWNPYLETGSADLYRGLRKSHHRWPYSWVPYIRSGDPRFLRYAQAATRQMYDANFCHYVSADVAEKMGEQRPRRRGIWHQALVPWAGRSRGPVTRNYSNQMDYFWHAYYVNDDRRALDTIKLWQEEVKVEENLTGRGPIGRDPRTRTAALHTFVDMYQQTQDPWFLVGAHALAERDLAEHASGNLQPHPLRDEWFWRDWRPAIRDYYLLTGDPDWKAFALTYVADRGSQNYSGWAGQGQIEPNATGWMLTKDPYYQRRLLHELDWVRYAVYLGEPDYFRGYMRHGVGAPMFTSWYLYDFPLALDALREADPSLTPLPNRFWEQGEGIVIQRDGVTRQQLPVVYFEKAESESLPMNLSTVENGTLFYRIFHTGDHPYMEGSVEIETPSGLASARPIRNQINLEIPADAPAGGYRMEMQLQVSTSRAGRISVPVTMSQVPEVFVNESLAFASVGHSDEAWNQYWFRIPEDLEVFEVEFEVPTNQNVRRLTIWNTDLEPVWDRYVPAFTQEGPQKILAQIAVPAEQRGTLWRITLPGRGASFRILSEIEPYFSASRERWFSPRE